jgi:hypothetical protein
MLGSRALFLKPWSAAVSEEKDVQSCIKHLTNKENCKRISEEKDVQSCIKHLTKKENYKRISEENNFKNYQTIDEKFTNTCLC